jgi:hypothetical protein
MEELTYVLVGPDRFRAQVIAEACRDAGLDVELLTSDAQGTGPHMGWAENYRLLVRTHDLDAVAAIVEQSRDNARTGQPETAP